MRRTIFAILLAASAALAVTGCVPGAGPSQEATTGPTPATTLTATPPAPSVSPTATAPIAKALPVTVYFEYHGKLQAVGRTAPAGTTGLLQASMKALLDGPTPKERAGGLSTRIPTAAAFAGARILGKVANVVIGPGFATGSTASMRARLAQVVYTATQFPTVAVVTVQLDPEDTAAFAKAGIPLSQPRMRKDFDSDAPAIFVDSPAWGGTLTNGDTMRGTANVFEATFRIQIRNSRGKLLSDSVVTAASGTGTRGDWAVKASFGVSARTNATMKVFDASAKDGKPENVVAFPIVLKPS